MKRKIYSLLAGTKQSLFALALTVFSAGVYAQNTYTFNYAGSTQQTISLQAGTYTIETWGADGGDNLGNGGTTYLQMGGKGGYSRGTYTLATTTTVYVNVGGRGGNSTTTLNVTVPGGYNGGGYGSLNTTSGKCSGAGGGGASHVATASGQLSSLGTNTVSVLIVGGAGGGAGESNYANNNTAYNSNGGNAGGLSGLQNPATGYQGRMGQGGTQFAGGGGGDNGSAIAGVPLQGIFGAGGYNTASGANASAGGAGIGGGGAGWYGGGSGWGGAATAYMAGAGGGGSGYIGGVTSGTTIGYGQLGFVTNPDITGNGRVLITELCSVRIYGSGTNSLSPAICSGSSLTLTTNAATNFTWSTGNTTNTTIVVSPTSNQTYSIIGTSTAGCQSSGFINVTVNSGIPVLSITNSPNTICLGKTATITAGGALSYTWTGGTPTPTNGVSFLPGGGINTYTVTGQNGCGFSTAVTILTVSPLAVSIVASSTAVCAGSTMTLSATSAVTGYTWQPGPVTGSTAIYGPVVNTVYTVTASDGTCSGVASISITTKATPTLSIVSSATAVCQGAAVTMTASGAINYSWSPGTQVGATNSDNPSGPTVYVVTGTNALGCSASSSTFVLTFASPTVVINANKTMVCAGDQVLLAASGATSYVWSGGPATAGYTVNPLISTNYVVTGSDNGCTGTKTISINVLTASVAINSSTTSICNGGSVNLNASGANTYTWSGAQITGAGASVTAMPTTTSVYTISATTTTVSVPTLKCPSFASISITVFNNPTVSISTTKTLVCKQDASLTLTGLGATSYSWSNNASTTSISVHPQTNTTYTITGIDNNGCSSTGSLDIKVNACTGITSFNAVASSLLVYPNPSNGTFSLKADAAMELILVNELGQRVMNIKLQESSNYTFEMKDLKPGIYFIQNEKGSTTAVQKIVVN